VCASDGTELARGLTNYSAAEARLIARKPSSAFEAVLGYLAEPELIHRDNMILVSQVQVPASP
jgi:glutamate 5-kinase